MDSNDSYTEDDTCELCKNRGRLEDFTYCACESGTNRREHDEEFYEWSLQKDYWKYDSDYDDTHSEMEPYNNINIFGELPYDISDPSINTDDSIMEEEVSQEDQEIIESLASMIHTELQKNKYSECEIIVCCKYFSMLTLLSIPVIRVKISGITQDYKKKFEDLITYLLETNNTKFRLCVNVYENINTFAESAEEHADYVLTRFENNNTYIIRKDRYDMVALYKDRQGKIWGVPF